MSCHTTEHGACAQALRCIIERPLTRNELASIMCRGYGAAAAHVAQLLAIRAIEHAGNVRSPTGQGYVQTFRAAPNAWEIFEAAKLVPPPPKVTDCRLELLALISAAPATVQHVAAVTRRSTRNARKVMVEMLDAGFLARSDDKPALYSVTSVGREVMA